MNRTRLAALLVATTALSLSGYVRLPQAQDGKSTGRESVRMDSARMAKLYVSDRHADHPVSAFAAQKV